MAYNNIVYGFKVNTDSAIDDRIVLTKYQMRTIDDSRMPEVYMAVCSDDGKFYVYNKDNEPIDETGKFYLFDEGSVKDIRVNGVSKVDHETKIADINVPFTVNSEGLLMCRFIAEEE